MSAPVLPPRLPSKPTTLTKEDILSSVGLDTSSPEADNTLRSFAYGINLIKAKFDQVALENTSLSERLRKEGKDTALEGAIKKAELNEMASLMFHRIGNKLCSICEIDPSKVSAVEVSSAKPEESTSYRNYNSRNKAQGDLNHKIHDINATVAKGLVGDTAFAVMQTLREYSYIEGSAERSEDIGLLLEMRNAFDFSGFKKCTTERYEAPAPAITSLVKETLKEMESEQKVAASSATVPDATSVRSPAAPTKLSTAGLGAGRGGGGSL